VLFISQQANIKEDPVLFLPRAIIEKRGYQIISVNEISQCVSRIKELKANIKAVIVSSTDEENTKLYARVLRIVTSKYHVPIFFIAESFSVSLHEYLIKLGLINHISLAKSSSEELVLSFNLLLRTLSHSEEKLATHQRRQIISELTSIKTIPPLPDIYFKIETLAQDANATPSQYSEILEYDTAITARIVRMANSAYYGFQREIRTVKDAVSLMGTKTVVSLVRIASITNNLKVSKDVENSVKKVWQHSATCAIAAQEIVKGMTIDNKNHIVEQMLIYGILHDIGKIILWNVL
jgi:HD-like signal output (HDOD) protein